MNIQSRVAAPGRSSRARGGAKRSMATKLFTLLNVIMLLGAVFCILNYRISLNQKIAEVQKETANVEREIRKLDLEIESLRIKREKLTSWTHVRKMIQAYRLPLIEPAPEQVQKLVLRDPVPYLPEPKILFPERKRTDYAVAH